MPKRYIKLPDGSIIEADGAPVDSSLSIGGAAADAAVVGEKFTELSEAIAEQEKMIPHVYSWVNAELPFTEDEISDTASGAGFVVNPTNFADGKTYFRYHAGTTSFTWTNPNPQKGSVTITARGISQWGGTGGARLLTIYDDGTYGPVLYIVANGESQTSMVTTDPEKTLAKITGNYDLENWILLDMDVMSIVADYSMPTDLGITGAVVGQTVKIAEVDENGKPVRWEAVEMKTAGTGGGVGSGGGIAFVPGNALELTEGGVLNVRTTDEAEEDNTLPITSSGVHTIVGNIGAILDTI